MEKLPYESIIKVEGTVVARPQNMVNKKQATGEVEVLLSKLYILNKACDNLPFNIREFQKAKEALRMQYRYLDLRFVEMQRNMRVRSRMLMDMRDFLINKCGFIDVETPTLFKATPGVIFKYVNFNSECYIKVYKCLLKEILIRMVDVFISANNIVYFLSVVILIDN